MSPAFGGVHRFHAILRLSEGPGHGNRPVRNRNQAHPPVVLAIAACVFAALCLATVTLADARIVPVYGHFEQHRVASGSLDNPAAQSATVFSQRIDLGPNAMWARVLFSDVQLPRGSVVKVTSLLDGEFQILSQRTMKEWGNASAFFNGPSLQVEIIAGPRTTGNRIAVPRVLVGDPGPPPGITEPEAICGADDTRQPSNDPAVARLLTGTYADTTTYAGGCSGFIIDRPDEGGDRCMLSAGHCFVAGTKPDQASTVVEFNVGVNNPPSRANCTLIHPPIAKQFAVNPAAILANNGGVGDDWAVFHCFPNPNTGRTPFQEQAAAKILAAAAPVDSATLRVTGYGADANDGALGDNNAACGACANPNGARNQIQQTDIGAFINTAGTALRHRVDTCGGNSGSPIILVRTGEVVGIHTHAGCEVVGDHNKGTVINHGALLQAITALCSPIDSTHYWSYSLETSQDTLVTIHVRDQFLSADVAVDTLSRLVNWVRKNNSFVRDTTLHFTWWNIRDKIPVHQFVEVANQFGTHRVKVSHLEFLLAPALKNDPLEPTDSVSHYLCYRTSGFPGPGSVYDLEDEWRVDQQLVYPLEYLCVPCWKTHDSAEYAPFDSVTHLAAFEIHPQSDRFLPRIEDQFVAGDFAVRQRFLEYLFVPSTKEVVSGVGVDPAIGAAQVLLTVRPNPIRKSGRIDYSLASPGQVDLEIFGINGRRVRTLYRGLREPGTYGSIWDGTDDRGVLVPSGMYFARLRTAHGESLRAIVYLR